MGDWRVHEIIRWWVETYEEEKKKPYVWTGKDAAALKFALRYFTKRCESNDCIDTLQKAAAKYLTSAGFAERRGWPFADFGYSPQAWDVVEKKAKSAEPRVIEPARTERKFLSKEEMIAKVLEEERAHPGTMLKRHRQFLILGANNVVSRIYADLVAKHCRPKDVAAARRQAENHATEMALTQKETRR